MKESSLPGSSNKVGTKLSSPRIPSGLSLDNKHFSLKGGRRRHTHAVCALFQPSLAYSKEKGVLLQSFLFFFPRASDHLILRGPPDSKLFIQDTGSKGNNKTARSPSSHDNIVSLGEASEIGGMPKDDLAASPWTGIDPNPSCSEILIAPGVVITGNIDFHK